MIVVQNDVGNKFSPTTLIYPLTSKAKKSIATHVEITPEDGNVEVDSIALFEQVRVIDKERLLKNLGKIKNQDKLKEIDRKLIISFGIGA